MYRIVAHNPDGSSYTIYDPAGTGALPVLAPRTTEELNEAGSLEFALVVGHPAYGLLQPKATYFTVELDGEEFFYGRLLTPEESPLLGQIQYTCSGALSLLQDSELPADGKKSDGTMDSKTMTAEAFFRKCINNHNSDIGNDPRRTFTVGIVNHPDKDKEREYQISSYTDTLSAIKQNIIEWYGGFLRVRSDGNGGHLIDWLSQYGDTDAGTLDLGENIISMTHRISTEDMVTAIRPVGKDGLLLSGSPTIDLFPAADMQKYGKIVKSVTFSDCEKEADLRTKANEFVARINNTYHISSDIKLVDMHFVDGQDHGVNLGDVFTNIYRMEGTSLIVGNRSRDFENPQNDSVSLKSPRDYEGDTSGGSYNSRNGSSSSLSSRSARNSASAGYSYKYIHEFQDRLELNTKEIAINAETLELHADQLIETANNFTRLSHRADTLESKVGIIEGTGVIQNSEHITSIAGKFQLNQETNQVELISGTEFVVHERNGATITVGERLTNLTSETNSLGQRIATFEGSALWTQRNNITGVVGEFDVVTAQDGTKTLRVKSGGGIKILRNQQEFGLYDSGSLTAGVIVNKINNGTTKILGSNVIIEGNTTIADVLSITAAGLTTSRAMAIAYGGGTTIISSSAIATDTYSVRDSLVFPDGSGSQYIVSASVLGSMIKTASKSNGTLTLTRFDGTSLTFSSATTLSGNWSSGEFTVNASPQGQSSRTKILDLASGDITWNGNTASIALKANINGGTLSLSTGKTLTLNATSRYNAGSPSSGAVSTKASTIYTWNFQITKGDGSTKTLEIDCRSIYSDARSGYYTQSQYTTYGNTRYTDGQTYGESIGIGGVHHIRLDYRYGQGGAHANNWWNTNIYNSDSTKSMLIETNKASTGLYLPIVMNLELTANGTYNPWSYTAEGGGTGVVFGPIKVNVPSGGSGSYTKYTFSKTRTQSSDGYHYTFAIGTGWTSPFGTSGGTYDLYKKN